MNITRKKPTPFPRKSISGRNSPYLILLFALTANLALSVLSLQAGSYATDFNSGLPANSTVYGTAAVEAAGGFTNSGCLKLTGPVQSQNGSFIITNSLDPDATVVGFVARFKALVGGGTGADGFSFNFAPDLPAGGFAEEGGGTGLTVAFDTFDNGNEVVGIDVKVGGTSYGSYSTVNLRQNAFVDVTIMQHPNGYLDVIYDGVYAITNLFTGFNAPARSLFGMGARTGGSTDNHLIDDLNITTQTAQTAFLDFYFPAGRTVRADSPVVVVLTDNVTAVDTAKITLKVDGQVVTPSITQQAPNTTIRYVAPTLMASGSSHSVEVTWADNTSPTPVTNTFLYGFSVAGYGTLSPGLIANSNLVSSTRGFAVRVSQIDANRGPSIQRAEAQLAGTLVNPDTGLTYPNRATLTATNERGVINYSTLGARGSFISEPPNSIPGLPGQYPDASSSGDTNAALDVVTYLYLTPGLYSLGVNSSDGFRLTAASTPDMFAQQLSAFDAVRAAADTVTTFAVAEAGYYPFRICYFIGGLEIFTPTADDPSLEFFTVSEVGEKVLINESTVATHVPAFLPAQTLPYVRSVSPVSGATGVSKNTSIEINLVDGSITVAPGSADLQMRLNGTSVTPAVAYGVTNAGVTTVRYQPASPLALNSSNYVEFAFSDSAANRRTNSFYFIVENVLTQLFAISPLTTDPILKNWVSSSGTERGLAYNPKTGHVLLVSRRNVTAADAPTNSLGVAVLDGNTGAYIKQLKLRDDVIVTGPTFRLNMIDVAEDGVIFAASLATSGSQVFNIYRWANEDAEPTLAYTGNPTAPSGTPRWGDSFRVRGSGSGTIILASGNNTAANTIPLFTTTDGTNFTMTLLAPTGLPNNSARLGVDFGCGNSFYGMNNGTGNALRHASFIGAPSTVGALMASYTLVESAGNQDIGPIGVDLVSQRLVGAATLNATRHSMNLWDLDALVAGATNRPIDAKLFPVSVGTFGTGSVDFTPDGTRVYTLDTGSGIIAFSLAPKPAKPVICGDPQPMIVAGPGAVGFMDVTATGAPQKFQWRLNGAPIANATNRTLDIYNVQNANLGYYSVVISNSMGSVTSQVAVLDTKMAASVSATSQTVPVDGTISLSAGITNGLPPYTYQWMLNGVPIATASSSTYSKASATINDAGGYSVMITDSLMQSVTSAVSVVDVGTLGTGTGLAGSYFNVPAYTENQPPDPFGTLPALTRVDAAIDFDWGTLGSPDPSVTADYFTARWQGQVQPLYSQDYKFYTRTDDGVRLWVNGQLLINQWIPQAPTEVSNTIALVANQKYPIVMEYYEKAGGAVAQLAWSSASQYKQIIPMTQLYPVTGAYYPKMTSTLFSGTNIVINWVGTGVLESAPEVSGPWTPILTNAGPYVIPVGATTAAYFRLLSQQSL